MPICCVQRVHVFASPQAPDQPPMFVRCTLGAVVECEDG